MFCLKKLLWKAAPCSTQISESMGAIRWGRRGRDPSIFQTVGI